MQYDNIRKAQCRMADILNRIDIDLSSDNANLENTQLLISEFLYIGNLARGIAEHLQEELQDMAQDSYDD